MSDSTACDYFDIESASGTSDNSMYVTGTVSGTANFRITSYELEDDYNRFTTLIGEHEQWSFNLVMGTYQRPIHEPHRYKVMPGKEPEEGTFLTERLFPLDEMIEVEGIKSVVEHLRKLLRSKKYREEQLRVLNVINRQNKVPEVKFDRDVIKAELKRYDQRRKVFRRLKKIQKVAEKLLHAVVPDEQLAQLKDDKRIEIIARNGNVYEILKSGKVNKLLPDGKKKGLCLVVKKGTYPVADIILLKKLMLEAEPENFEKIAITCAPFAV